MKFSILNETSGRIRFRVHLKHMTYEQADTLLYNLKCQSGFDFVKVQERTCDGIIRYSCSRQEVIDYLQRYNLRTATAPEDFIANSGRELNNNYQNKLVNKILSRYAIKWLLPLPVRIAITGYDSIKYFKEGFKTLKAKKIQVPVLDATAIGVSMLRNDFDTASSIMFLLGIGELLEEWTHKKSVDDLARSMSLNIDTVWKKDGDNTYQVSATDIKIDDKVVVHMGATIPFDGIVLEGEGFVNQSTMTGESEPVRKEAEAFVYAGTVLEDGELTILVKAVGNASRFSKIVTMIEESEKLKSSRESQAEHLADKLVPYTLFGTALTYLLTRNITKALSILMVDFSCALKLAMPISVLSAIREASEHNITVKGGKFLEAIAEADTIVFDKTGTLTEARPKVVDVVSFCEESPDDLLRIAACMEEHFLHSMAKAVVQHAHDKGIDHSEMHSKVEYVVAHGISTHIDDKRAIIGSYHFVFEDEKATIDEKYLDKFHNLPKEYSHLYLAIEDRLVAVILIEDPLRPNIPQVINRLREVGFKNIVMMTGDSERTAANIAKQVGVDAYYSEVLPEDKARFVSEERAKGHKVVMIGDGVNDSPALSAADVGIAISEGSDLAREIADVTIRSEDLNELVTLKEISLGLVKRIDSNYKKIMTVNGGLIALGVTGVIMPTTSALLHNTSTLLIGLDSMTKIIK